MCMKMSRELLLLEYFEIGDFCNACNAIQFFYFPQRSNT